MHIADGILSWPVLAGGAAACCIGVGIGLRGMRGEDVPEAALLGAAFFVGSLIHIPAGAGSAHLLLTGLTGILLGWKSFPVLLIALLLHAVLLGHGGLTALGVNTFNMALPAVVCGCLFGRGTAQKNHKAAAIHGFAAGVLGIMMAVLMGGGALGASGREFLPVVWVLVLLHLPVAGVEGVVAASAIGFLKKVKPEILAVKREGYPQKPN